LYSLVRVLIHGPGLTAVVRRGGQHEGFACAGCPALLPYVFLALCHSTALLNAPTATGARAVCLPAAYCRTKPYTCFDTASRRRADRPRPISSSYIIGGPPDNPEHRS